MGIKKVTNFRLSEETVERLAELAKRGGVTQALIVQRAVDLMWEGKAPPRPVTREDVMDVLREFTAERKRERELSGDVIQRNTDNGNASRSAQNPPSRQRYVFHYAEGHRPNPRYGSQGVIEWVLDRETGMEIYDPSEIEILWNAYGKK